MEINQNLEEKERRKAILEKWKKLFNDDLLTGGHFREHWRIWVPKAFIPPDKNEKGFEWEVNEEVVQNVLLAALEEFICNGNSSDFFNYLSANDPPPSVCGKVFKMGEPSYNCRDCSTDVTCVLCVGCFKQSAHRFHKYKMGTSMGGGCCDCGDTEAWTSDPYCDCHLAGVKSKSENVMEFPKDLIQRAECVFNAVLQYCSEALTLDHYPGLPRNLRLREEENPNVDPESYCTLLYDHESYTFEEVVSTLATVLHCPHRNALDYVTSIDREGRTIIKCSSFHHCNELKLNIEKITSRHGSRPLESIVVQSQVVAHQMFALRLLNWLLKLTNLSKGFRKIFTCTALNLNSFNDASDLGRQNNYESREDKPHPSFVEGILLQDLFLWKTARLHWHRLFIAGMFIEYENKKAFSKVFANHYCTLIRNFIREDHDYSFSFASLSIQMFTVPTLAIHLIAHEDVMFKLLNTFVAECCRKRNDEGKLEFSRSTSLGSFRRAMSILHDLRYLLHSPPEVWTDELRRGFLKGVTMILNLLTYMQGMSAVKRQVGQHLEYEPEWETAFNLQTKLSPVITMILKWCSTDQIVFIKVYRLTLKKLFENSCDEYKHIEKEIKVANHKAVCYDYDVTTEPVSIHLPLSRFLAGLFLLLGKFGFSFYSDDFISLRKQTPQQILEPVLRTQVMIAQVQAGMWRKNGYSLSNQIYYYHNVKCRREMQDKDIVILQVGASLIDSNEYLLHLLNKFKLLDWVNPEFETSFFNYSPSEYLKTSPKVVEEFLSLLVTIVSERFVVGVGEISSDDCLKNEIIHQLFIKPLSHSELSKTLPEDANRHETGMEKVIDEVAIFKKPLQSCGKGVYTVKNELMDRYNVYFHHYSKEDMSKSEEEQRKQRKASYGYECCPPPCLPHFTSSFKGTLNLLQCDVMFYIIKTVLERTLDIKARSGTEGQLHAVLYLIGLALREQEQNYNVIQFTLKAEQWGIKDLLEEIFSTHRIEAHKDLVRWTIDKFRAIASPLGPSETKEIPSLPFQMGIEDQQEKNNRAKLAAEKRATILAEMAVLQQNFLKENADLFHTDSNNLQEIKLLKAITDSSDSVKSDVTVSLGCKQSTVFVTDRTITCILCQEDQTIKTESPVLILSTFIQRSTVLNRKRAEEYSFNQVLGSNIGPAIHLSTCGHIMHYSCWKKYINTVVTKQTRRPYRILRQTSPFDIEKNEYLCPLCQCLSNTVLPIIPHLSVFCKWKGNSPEEIRFSDWHEISLMILERNRKIGEWETRDMETDSYLNSTQNEKITSENSQISLNLMHLDDDVDSASEVEMVSKWKPKQHIFTSNANQKDWGLMSSATIEVVNLFTDACSKNDFDEKRDSPEETYLRIWKICAYTIHSLECHLRHTNKSLLGDFSSREQECMENLIRLSGAVVLVSSEKESVNNICLQIFERLFNSIKSDSVLEWDSLGILVPLTICTPIIFYKDTSPVALGKTIEKHCFRTALLIHFAQTILCTDLSNLVFQSNGDVTSEETKCLNEIVRTLKDCQGINTIEVWNVLKKSSISFLRCSTIFYHFLTGVPASKSLKEIGGDTFENMMDYLGMPSCCKQLLGDPCILPIFMKWAKHPACFQLRHQITTRNMLPMNELVKLPEDYSEIINTAATFTCPNSDSEDVRNPAMCLICGQMLCSETYCCQSELNQSLVGACNYHAYSCGCGIGIFLRIRECEVLLLAGPDRGCFMPAPYLDDYGEVDQGLKRGNRMQLCQERYRQLQLLWMSHGIPEYVARSIEHNDNINYTQWHHL